MVISALVIVSTLIMGFALTASAASQDIYPRVWDKGAFVDIRGAPVDGELIFEYGWVTRNQFANPPVGYWLDIYHEDPNGWHYEWAFEKTFNKLAPRSLDCFDNGEGLSPGIYKINFFVRDVPQTSNVAEIIAYFTVPD